MNLNLFKKKAFELWAQLYLWKSLHSLNLKDLNNSKLA